MSKSKSGWLLYAMVHIPGIWRFKVGITSLNIGAKARAASIDKEMFGFPFPIMILPVPGAYHIEQALHRMMKRYNVRFYSGSGHSEWFILAPLFIAVPIMLCIWGLYLAALDYNLNTSLLPFCAEFIYSVYAVVVG